nr:enhanced serine sensitivity protein SseB C-terminal domain-containing protein [uncultured Flavobacterium sp.]
MGLFDIFKKKSAQSSQDELSLEILLQKSANDPKYRAEFYKRMLTDELVVIADNSGLLAGIKNLEVGSDISFVSYPDGKIPLFTSKERIFDKGIVKEEVEIIQMKGKNLFELTKGATFLLNPYSDYGKEILPNEIESLLNGTILIDNHKEIIVKKDAQVKIGQPAVYPIEIINELKVLFGNNPIIKAAYLGWIFNPESGEPAHYIFALEGDGDIKSITNEAGSIAYQLLPSGEFVDIIKIGYNGGLSDYFLKSTTPFYKL